jgi:hypothetical protein
VLRGAVLEGRATVVLMKTLLEGRATVEVLKLSEAVVVTAGERVLLVALAGRGRAARPW